MSQNPPNTPVGQNYFHINTAGTVVVKTSPGLISALNVNTASSGATLAIYDTATTTLGTLEVGSITIGTTTVVPSRLPLGIDNGGYQMTKGIAIVTTGTLDVTLAFR